MPAGKPRSTLQFNIWYHLGLAYYLQGNYARAYDAYVERRVEPMTRGFSLERALRNREHHTVAGLVAGFALSLLALVFIALKAFLAFLAGRRP